MDIIATVDRTGSTVNASGLWPLLLLVLSRLNVGAEPCAASCLGAFEDNLVGEDIRVNFRDCTSLVKILSPVKLSHFTGYRPFTGEPISPVSPVTNGENELKIR